ncbi:hypothetical protein GQ53DRAFT_828749 [Thozetella sp. PMI_491]|nr:hypothetical protein GQ53DRAFT_828749 [Thozetella sp. PMI_491]
MDPLSAIGLLSGLAGIASAGASLSKALYDVASTIRGAPKEMEAVAQGIHDLSVVLDQMRRVLKEGKRMHKRRLRKGIHGVLCRIEDIHFEIRDMLSTESRLGRLKWVFRKPRIAYLMTRIESHKNTVSLMMQTMLIAIEQRRQDRHLGYTEDSGDEKRRYRRQAENTVKTTLSSLRRLRQSEIHEESRQDGPGSISDPPRAASPENSSLISPSDSKVDVGADITPDPAGRPDTRNDTNLPLPERSNQIQKWITPPDDTATWLYHMIFSDRDIFPKKFSQMVDRQELFENRGLIRIEQPDVSKDSRQEGSGQEGSWHDFISAASGIVDSLLYEWTELTQEEIEETRDVTDEDLSDDWQLDLQDAVESIKLKQENEAHQNGNSMLEEDQDYEAAHMHSYDTQAAIDNVDVCPKCRQGIPNGSRKTSVLEVSQEILPTPTMPNSSESPMPDTEVLPQQTQSSVPGRHKDTEDAIVSPSDNYAEPKPLGDKRTSQVDSRYSTVPLHQEAYPVLVDHRGPPPENKAQYLSSVTSKSEGSNYIDLDELRTRLSERSRHTSTRTRGEAATDQQPLLPGEADHRSQIRSSKTSTSSHPPIIQRSYTYDAPGDGESYVSARTLTADHADYIARSRSTLKKEEATRPRPESGGNPQPGTRDTLSSRPSGGKPRNPNDAFGEFIQSTSGSNPFLASYKDGSDVDDRPRIPTLRKSYTVPIKEYDSEEELPTRSRHSRRSPDPVRYAVGEDNKAHRMKPREALYKVKTAPSYGVDDVKHADVPYDPSSRTHQAY